MVQKKLQEIVDDLAFVCAFGHPVHAKLKLTLLWSLVLCQMGHTYVESPIAQRQRRSNNSLTANLTQLRKKYCKNIKKDKNTQEH